MNRQQRRAQGKDNASIEMIDLRTVVTPHNMTMQEVSVIAQYRVQDNCLQTGHPYHHLTASGVIVDADPTLEYFFHRLASDPSMSTFLAGWKKQLDEIDTKDALNAIPVNRTFYGSDPYAQH